MNKRSFPRQAFSLARKELYSYSITPAAYGIAVFFLLFTSIWLFYFQRFFTQDVASLRPYFSAFPLVFVLVIPGITMKSWAEERKVGSVELLLTMPFSEWDLVIGKFLASFGVLAAILALSVPVPLSISGLGTFDGGVILTEYAGALLLGATATAVGLLMSALSKNQAASFLASAAVLLVIMMANQVTTAANIPNWLNAFINFISLAFHFESFSKGLLDSRDLAFFILTCALFLFINTRVILFRKWR